jgi:hypothetical protein
MAQRACSGTSQITARMQESGRREFACRNDTARHDGAMSDVMPHRAAVAGPGFPRLALGLAWFCTSVGAGVLAWYLDRLASGIMLGVAVLGLAATGAVVSNRQKRITLTGSALAGLLAIIAGAATAAVVAISAETELAGAVAVSSIPIVGGIVCTKLTQRSRRMAG